MMETFHMETNGPANLVVLVRVGPYLYDPREKDAHGNPLMAFCQGDGPRVPMDKKLPEGARWCSDCVAVKRITSPRRPAKVGR